LVVATRKKKRPPREREADRAAGKKKDRDEGAAVALRNFTVDVLHRKNAGKHTAHVLQPLGRPGGRGFTGNPTSAAPCVGWNGLTGGRGTSIPRPSPRGGTTQRKPAQGGTGRLESVRETSGASAPLKPQAARKMVILATNTGKRGRLRCWDASDEKSLFTR